MHSNNVRLLDPLGEKYADSCRLVAVSSLFPPPLDGQVVLALLSDEGSVLESSDPGAL